MSEVGHRRGAGAEEGAGGEEVVVVAGAGGTVEPLQMGERVLAGGGHLGLVPTQLDEEQRELLGLSGTTVQHIWRQNRARRTTAEGF